MREPTFDSGGIIGWSGPVPYLLAGGRSKRIWMPSRETEATLPEPEPELAPIAPVKASMRVDWARLASRQSRAREEQERLVDEAVRRASAEDMEAKRKGETD